jgi:hypothetical protein
MDRILPESITVILSHPILLRFIIILSSHLTGLPVRVFPAHVPKKRAGIFCFLHLAHMLQPSNPSRVNQPKNAIRRADFPKVVLSICLLGSLSEIQDRFCGLVVRVPGYKSKGPGFGSRRYQIFWEIVGLERGPLSLMMIIEGLLETKSSDSSLENRN